MAAATPSPPPPPTADAKEADDLFGSAGSQADVALFENQEADDQTSSKPPIRTNLKETVFFLPNLKTDEEGNILIKFTMNEALTRWKFLGLAHTKDLKFATTQKEVVTQKELMITPTPPRFFREGDVIAYTCLLYTSPSPRDRG